MTKLVAGYVLGRVTSPYQFVFVFVFVKDLEVGSSPMLASQLLVHCVLTSWMSHISTLRMPEAIARSFAKNTLHNTCIMLLLPSGCRGSSHTLTPSVCPLHTPPSARLRGRLLSST